MKFPWQKDEKTGEAVMELPDELVDQIKKGSEAASKLSTIESTLADLKSIMASSTEAADNEKKEAAARAAAAARAEEEGSVESKIEQLMLEGKTKEAIALATQGQTQAIKAVHADNVRRELFEDQDKFKYYHGDIKREVDALLANQVVDFRMNPANIENCYNTVIGKKMPEILEGKIKTRFATSSGGSTATGAAGDSGVDDKKNLKLSEEAKKAARLLGFSEEDYKKMLDEEGVAYV
jgi:phage I-like protein